MRSVKRWLNWSLKQGFIEVNPVAALEMPSADHKEVAFTPEQIAAKVATLSPTRKSRGKLVTKTATVPSTR